MRIDLPACEPLPYPLEDDEGTPEEEGGKEAQRDEPVPEEEDRDEQQHPQGEQRGRTQLPMRGLRSGHMP